MFVMVIEKMAVWPCSTSACRCVVSSWMPWRTSIIVSVSLSERMAGSLCDTAETVMYAFSSWFAW